MSKTKLILSLFFLFSLPLQAADILMGDTDAAENESFSFAVQQRAMSSSEDLQGAYLYVAADPAAGGADQVKEFAVSRVARDKKQFVGLTPEKVRLNSSKEDVANPLYDQGISFLGLLNAEGNPLQGSPERPVVVLSSDHQSLYYINSFTETGKNIQVVTPFGGIKNIPDANGDITAGIVGLTTEAVHSFAAVKPTAGSFGDVGSGVALVIMGAGELQGGGTFTGPIISDASSEADIGKNRAAPLDISSPFLKIGTDLVSIDSVVDMCWHSNMGRLYVALQVTGASGATDGVRAIAVGRLTKQNKIEFNPIAPIAVFDGSLDKIVGAQTADAQVSIHKVRPMTASSTLPYLIVQGGVGAPSATKRMVYALPLVNGSSDESVTGSIATTTATPEDVFTDTTIPLFNYRVIKNQATTAAQMPLSTDAATQVGGGALLNGDITDLTVRGDAIFVAVQTPTGTQTPGIFYSQALLDEQGKIKSWTIWRRAAGTRDHVLNASLDPVSAKISYLAENASGQINIVKRTSWEDGDANGLAPVIDSASMIFPKLYAGVQGVHDFVLTSAALGTQTPGLLDTSLLVLTGYKGVMLVQTSSETAGVVSPYGGADFGDLISYTNGEITDTFPVSNSKKVAITGGALDDIGPILAAEIAKDGASGSNGWLFVGGVGGIAVLSNADGSGWNTSSGISINFTGLTAGMSFKQVGTYGQVRKLMHDDHYLYVLTDDKLDRIDLTQGNVGLGAIVATTIATNQTIPGVGSQGTLFDLVISEKLAVLATSCGLFRLANGLDVRLVDTLSASWHKENTPEGVGAVRQLVVVSTTGRVQDVARKSSGGHIYALSAYRGKNQAQLFRFSISSVIGTSITDTTMQRIPDLFVSGLSSYFANIGLFKNITATDGAFFFGTRDKFNGEDPSTADILFSKSGLKTGSRFLSNKQIPVDLSESSLIASLIQSSATGSWLIAGDHGIRANE